jgi:hypothetical protein
MQIKFENRKLRNPQGLDEILSEILCHPVHGDWDKDIPAIQDIGTLKKTAVPRRIGDVWGKMMETNAREYLAENLQRLGWNLKSERIHEREYDCIGRISNSLERASELAVEMYFPKPRNEGEYHLVSNHSMKMIDKLTRIQAKRKYVLIGVPKDTTIECEVFPHPTIKILFQEHKFKRLVFLDQH